MKPDDVAEKIFNAAYVDSYESRFQGGDWFKNTYLYDIELYGRVLESGGSWLDLGCGTGWHLSHFPDTDRVGLDVSPSMIEHAAEANPGASFVVGSFLDPHPEWEGRFDLITMSGWAYSYLDTLDDIELLIENMARWSSPDGTVILWVGDGEELVYGTWMPWYDNQDPRWWGQNVLAVIYDWEDVPAGVRHERMIAPQARMFARLFGRYFSDIHIERYPLNHQHWVRQKSLVATKKRKEPIEVWGNFPVEERFPPTDHPLEAKVEPDPPGVDSQEPAPEPAPSPADDATPAPVATSDVPPEEPAAVSPEEPVAVSPELSRRQHLWLGMPRPVRSLASKTYRLMPSGLRRRLSSRIWS